MAILATLSLSSTLGCSAFSSRPIAPSLQTVSELESVGGSSSVGTQLRAPVVMVHFLASWCTLCAFELPHLIALRNNIDEDRLGIIAIAVDDTPDAARTLAQQAALPFPLLIDEGGRAKELFGLTDLPTTVILTPEGAKVLLKDPKTDEATNRFVGAYTWDRGELLSSLKSLP